MAISLNPSTASGIPKDVYDAIRRIGSEVPGNWRVSLIPGSASLGWELKIVSPDGKMVSRILEPEDHETPAVEAHLRTLLLEAINIDPTKFIETWIRQLKNPETRGDFRQRLLQEIESAKKVLESYGTVVKRDVAGEAHTAAYLAALERERDAVLQITSPKC